jgi:glycosyltransferase involved in cell wall biosynthesis
LTPSLKIDVILPVYKAQRWADEAIESTLAQTYPHWHLTIVDDASPDDTAERMTHWTHAHPDRISLIRLKENQGPAGARMEAIRRTDGALVAFLDQDDRWRPRKLEKQVARLYADPPVEAVHTDVVHIDVDGNSLPDASEAENARRDEIPYATLSSRELVKNLFLVNSIRLASSVVLRQAFESIGGFDVTLFGGEDWEFWIRFASRYRIAHLPEPLVERRIHPRNTSSVYRRARNRGRLAALKKVEQSYPFLTSLELERLAKLLRAATISELDAEDSQAQEYAWRLARLKPACVEVYALLILASLGAANRPIVRLYRRIKDLCKRGVS